MLKRKGFTLIELLVVVLIIGILAAIALPQYQLAVLRTRYTQLMIMAEALRRAQDAYYLANGRYPLKISDLDVTIPYDDCREDADGGVLYCSQFTCAIYDRSSNSNGYVYCNTRKQGTDAYYMIYSLRTTPKYRCIASQTALGRKLCESFGGVYELTSGSQLDYYIL